MAKEHAWKQAALHLVLLCIFATSARIGGVTLPADKDALLLFKSALTSDEVTPSAWCTTLKGILRLACLPLPLKNISTWIAMLPPEASCRRGKLFGYMQGLLSSWRASTDPCDDGWEFLSCNCSGIYPPLSAQQCASATSDPSGQRVLQLVMGSIIQTQGRRLVGTVPAALGNLTGLRVLDLHGNELRVGPSTLSIHPVLQFILAGRRMESAWCGTASLYVLQGAFC
jgi:hypothetical protein